MMDRKKGLEGMEINELASGIKKPSTRHCIVLSCRLIKI